MKNLVPIAIIIIAIAGFNFYIRPIHDRLAVHKATIAEYEEAIGKAGELTLKVKDLTAKYNAIPASTLTQLGKLAPKNPDNVHLTADVNSLVAKHGRILGSATIENLPVPLENQPPYRESYLKFSFEGTYDNLVSLSADLEKSLRIMDIYSVAFKVDEVKSLTKYDMVYKIYSTP